VARCVGRMSGQPPHGRSVHIEPPPTADAPLLPRTPLTGSRNPADRSASQSPDSGAAERREFGRRWSAEAASMGAHSHSIADGFRHPRSSAGSGGHASFKQLMKMLQHEHDGTLTVMKELQHALAQSRKKLQESYMENHKLSKRLQELQRERADSVGISDDEALVAFTPVSSFNENSSRRPKVVQLSSATDGDQSPTKRSERAGTESQGPMDSTASTMHPNASGKQQGPVINSPLRNTAIPGTIDDRGSHLVQDAWGQESSVGNGAEHSHTLGGLSSFTKQPSIRTEKDRDTSVHFSMDAPALGRDITTATVWSRWQEGSDGAIMTPAETESKVRYSLRQNFLMYQSIARRNSGNDESWQEEVHDSHFHPHLRIVRASGWAAWLQPFIKQPACKERIFWEIIGAFLILYDVISIPLRVFDYPESHFTLIMDWVTLLYWTINVPASLCVGYIDKGDLIMDPRKIAKKYVKTWFWIDMLIITPDWVLTITSSNSSSGSSIRLLRIMRITRAIRLVRLAKMQWLLTLIDAKLESEYSTIVANIIKMICILVGISHFIACGWFVVAERQSGTTWLTHEADSFHQEDWLYQYVTAFHWSITQFTPASMHVQPHTLAERIYAVAVIVFALVGFSYVVGSITQSLTHLRSIKEHEKKQFWILKRYLRSNEIDMSSDNALGLRVQKYAEHAWRRQNVGVPQGNVPILDLLSEQLKKELRSAICIPHMRVHPLFKHLEGKAPVTVHRLADQAIKRKSLACNDKLFLTGETAEGVYFPIFGSLMYLKPGGEPEEVTEDEDWISEQSLWTEDWVHLGTATASEHSDLLQVLAEKLCEVVKLNPFSMQQVSLYAKKFMEWLNEQAMEDDEHLSDIIQGDKVSDQIRDFIPFTEKVDRGPTRTFQKANTVKSLMSSFGRRESYHSTKSSSESPSPKLTGVRSWRKRMGD